MRSTRYFIYFIAFSCFVSCTKDDSNTQQASEIPDFITPNTTVISIDSNDNSLLEISVDGTSTSVSIVNLTSEFGIRSDDFSNIIGNTLTWFRREAPNFKVWRRNLNTKNTDTFSDICAISEEFPAFVLGLDSRLVTFSEVDFGQGSAANIRITENGTNCTLTQLFDTGILSSTIEKDLWLFTSMGVGSVENTIQRVDIDSGIIKAAVSISESSVSITQNGNDLYVFFNDRYHVYDANTLSLKNVVPFIPSVGLIMQNGFFYSQFSGDSMLITLDVPQPNPFSDWPGLIDLTDGTLVSGDNLGFVLTNHLHQVDGYENVSLGNYSVAIEKNIIAYGFSDGNLLHGILYTNFDAEILKIIDLPSEPLELFITE